MSGELESLVAAQKEELCRQIDKVEILEIRLAERDARIKQLEVLVKRIKSCEHCKHCPNHSPTSPCWHCYNKINWELASE